MLVDIIAQMASDAPSSLRAASNLVRSVLGGLGSISLDVRLVDGQRVGRGPVVAEVIVGIAI